MRTTSLLCATILTVTLIFAQTAKADSAFDQQLIDQQKQLLHAAETKNHTAIERDVANDFQGIEINGDFYGKEELVESARNGTPKDTRAYEFQVVKLTKDSAVVAYNLIVPGEHPRYRHMADTWAKIDGQWKLKFRQITPNLWSAADLD
ncbi:MAG: nuclear transport factor 2 family protein [Terriglobales bacterium]|jgi:hypothetical protein